MRRLTVPLLVGLVLGAPAVAQADDFTGKTSQGRKAILSLDGRGEFAGFFVSWRSRCDGRGSYYRSATTFRPMLRKQTRKAFSHSNDYVEKVRGSIRAVVTVSVSGRRISGTRWRGTFEASVVVRESGRTLDRCRLGRLRWSVTRD